MSFDLSLLAPTLKQTFGFDSLRELQKPIVESVMGGKDTLAILKTSGGKSLCYQLPALYRGGMTLVISPLISLMKDQVDALTEKGVNASFVNSSLSSEEMQHRYQGLMSGHYTLFYVSPERFEDEGFMQALLKSPLHTVAIDEAHCASQWGHDFRPSYSRLGACLETVEARIGRAIQRVAFTATANTRVQTDICTMLKLREPEIHIQDFDRENLTYAVVMADKPDRTDDIVHALKEHPDDCTIIYCVTVREVKRLHQRLKEHGFNVNRYHGQLDSEEKTRVQEAFTAGDIPVLVSTSAFGMGVDKSDVRLVLHAQMPGSLEAWYQEAGRGGRDGKPAKAILFYHDNDKSIHRYFISASAPESHKIWPIKQMLFRILRHGPAMLDPKSIALNGTKQMQVINRALPDSGVDALKISAQDVSSTINFLKNQGELEAYDDLLGLGNWLDDADYQWVDDVRQNNWMKFNAMCSWAETHLCRRWQILRYFDERKPHYQCGNCDNCQRNALFKAANKAAERAVRPSTLMTLAKALDSVQIKPDGRWLHVLIGALPASMLEPNEKEYSGRFAWHAVADIKRWQSLLIEQQVINALGMLTEKGQDWIDGKLRVESFKRDHHRPEAGSGPVVTETIKTERIKRLRAWRKATAYREDIPDISIATEAQIKKIAAIAVIDEASLQQHGFSEKWVKQHASGLVRVIKKIEEEHGCEF